MSRDPSSLSNPDEARVTHLSWDAVVDFDKRQLFANASYDVRLCSTTTPPSPPVPVPTLRLDTSGLDVQRVTVCGKPATFSMSVPDPDRPHLGSRLEIDLRGSGGVVGVGVGVGVGGGDVDNSDRDDSNDGGVVISVSIQYATSPNASAAQWLPPSQTAGKEHPYVFSACFVSMHFLPGAPPAGNYAESH
jgi:leukotriene-A4 hydrolase